MAGIELSRTLAIKGRAATADEQRVLARWSSWGALPEIFDEDKPNWSTEREYLQNLLTDSQYAEARRTTINAHYTDPAYVREMWAALENLGFTGGSVLEPGVGAGTFIGLAPDTAEMVGVELDSTTAAIATALYPHATIRAESFADTRLPGDYFDATIGNVPFANVALHDPIHNATGHSIHNHFIIKSLALTRPGGLVAVLTSHYTLDSQNPSARRAMNQLADLVGAVRLPSGAHRRAAGTEAVTDLVIFRRREVGTPPVDVAWETVSPVDIDGTTIKLNSYFTWRPDHILGSMSLDSGMYGSQTLHVRAELDRAPERLRTALDRITTEAVEAGLVMTPRTAASEVRRTKFVPADTKQWDGTIVAHPGNTFTTVRNGGHEPLTVPKTTARELRSLLGLRDAATGLLEAEAATVEDTPAITAARAQLRERYAAYQTGYGPLNRFTLRSTGRVDPATGEEGTARIKPRAIAILKSDPFGPLVMALERFDEETQTAAPAALLTQRVVAKRPIVDGAETPSEAIALSLDRTGTIDLPTIAHLLGDSEDSAREQLGQLVYDEPDTGALIHGQAYLSGDVRRKLDAARSAAIDDARFAVNVAALEAVLPTPLGSDEIEAKLGAVWIDPATHQLFLREILVDPTVRVENPLPGEWEVRGNRGTIKATSQWGTTRRPATEIAAAVMEQRPLIVNDTYEEFGKKITVLNPLETTAAQEKATQLQERFSGWVWEDPERAARLSAEYNRRFNSIVLRDYTGAGAHLTLPGMAATFVPLQHQRDAVARAIAEPTAGLFHVVGAGKTAEMVMATMEQVRMGLIKKPAVIVPNHMLEQFGREWLQVYPRATILAASTDDLTGDKRRLFVARAAANDWDAIIMTYTAFERIALSPEAEKGYIERRVTQLRTVLDEAKGEDAMSVKRIEKAVLVAENNLKVLLDKPRDPGISFEATGIDYLVVDEMHTFKNLETASKIPGASIDGSGRASDLHMKLEYLRSRYGDRVITAATATPLANSITEAYVMQQYMRPDILEAAGIGSFDAWAATFGQTVTDMEMAPTGNGNFRLKTRFAKFQNVPEMLRMWHVFADVKTAEDLKLPTPTLRTRADGQRAPETIVLPPTPELVEYINEIGERAERVANRSVKPDEDNMLKISTDGRKAALDMRMVRAGEPTGITKLDVVAAHILTEWKATRDNEYLDVVTGEVSKARGGLQLVFSDLGTPNPDRWNAYDELQTKLVDGGMPAGAIRFIHEAKNDAEKARLFAAARGGHVAVLIGSTTKMGVGTNVQARVTMLHHVDVPWRPADVEQRDGRGMRQGNQNPELGIVRYVVERSFDSYMWQTIERKARFISQIMRGRLDVREIEDIGDTAMSAAEAKALSSGNPLLLEKANADNDLSRLQRLERAHQRNLVNLGHTRSVAASKIEAGRRDVEQLRSVVDRVVETTADAFAMTVDGRRYELRTESAQAILKWGVEKGLRYMGRASSQSFGKLGSIGGFDIDVASSPGFGEHPFIAVSLVDVPRSTVMISRDEFLEGGVGIVRQLENRAAGIPRTITEIEHHEAAFAAEVAEADARLSLPFKYVDELAAAEARAAAVARALSEAQASQVARPPAADAASGPLAAARESRRATDPTPAVEPTPPGPDVVADLAR